MSDYSGITVNTYSNTGFPDTNKDFIKVQGTLDFQWILRPFGISTPERKNFDRQLAFVITKDADCSSILLFCTYCVFTCCV